MSSNYNPLSTSESYFAYYILAKDIFEMPF